MSAVIRQMVFRKRASEVLADDLRERQEQIIAAARGAKGEDGATGPMPNHEWKGTKLRFETPDGWGKWTDLKGAPGDKGGLAVVGAGGGKFNPASLETLPTTPLLSDFLVLERDGQAYRVSLGQLQALFGGSGASATPTNAVTANSDAIRVNGEYVTIGDPVFTEEAMEYSKRVDSVGDTIIYRGEAVPGSAESAAVWRIRRIEFPAAGDVVETWAGGVATFIHAWDDRAILTYS